LKAGDKPQMVSDAWIAATAAQLGEVVHTFDRDFTKLLPPDKVFLLNR
jgi:predicted nucleic acid-binding protein